MVGVDGGESKSHVLNTRMEHRTQIEGPNRVCTYYSRMEKNWEQYSQACKCGQREESVFVDKSHAISAQISVENKHNLHLEYENILS